MTEKEALFEYCLRLGDNSLILGHRLSEWCGHGPILEEDIAIANVAQDLLGQARNLLTYAGKVEGKGRSEDDLAYLRDVTDFKNATLIEQENGDFGKTIMRQFLIDAHNFLVYTELCNSTDETIAAIAAKAIKEVTYHLRHSTQWVLRLGDGTEESHTRMTNALTELWRFTDDLFYTDEVDELMAAAGIGVDTADIKKQWRTQVSEVLQQATLTVPDFDGYMFYGGKTGKHTEHLGYILAEMQYLQRTYPGATW